MHSTALGAARAPPRRGRGRRADAAKGRELAVALRAAPARAEQSETVPKLGAEQCVDVLVEILWRQSGSKRRRLASGSAPSTRLLTPDVIATRCPALFWGLYDSSRTDRAMDGDVAFALQNALGAALERHAAAVGGARRAASAAACTSRARRDGANAKSVSGKPGDAPSPRDSEGGGGGGTARRAGFVGAAPRCPPSGRPPPFASAAACRTWPRGPPRSRPARGPRMCL